MDSGIHWGVFECIPPPRITGTTVCPLNGYKCCEKGKLDPSDVAVSGRGPLLQLGRSRKAFLRR